MSIRASIDSRYSFTTQFLLAAKLFATKAQEIEDASIGSLGDGMTTKHRAYVAGAIMQSVAALEAEIAEVISHGPGHHLGSNGIDAASREFLKPLADVIDGKRIVKRYAFVLHLLRREPMKDGVEPFQSAALLVRLRNELVHYKSKWGREMKREKLFKGLQSLRHPKPPFVQGNVNFFPHECLSAACAAWAFESAVAFLESFYDKLGVASPLEAYRTKLQ